MISVIVAVYNAERYIRKCLDSLLAQTERDFEVVCVDDASTDNSPSIIAEYVEKDPRFHLLRMEKNVGQAVARNRGIDHSTGDIVTALDADDWFDADSLRGIADTFEQFPETDCAVFRCMMVQEDGGGGNTTERSLMCSLGAMPPSSRSHGAYTAIMPLAERSTSAFLTTPHAISIVTTILRTYITIFRAKYARARDDTIICNILSLPPIGFPRKKCCSWKLQIVYVVNSRNSAQTKRCW